MKSDHRKKLKQEGLTYTLEHITEDDRDVVAEHIGFEGPKDALNVDKVRQLYLGHADRRRQAEREHDDVLYDEAA